LYSPFTQPSDAVVYTLFSGIILSETGRQEFVQELIKDVQEEYKESAKDFVEAQVLIWLERFTIEKNTEKTLIQQFENKPDYQQFKNFNPTRDGKQLTSKKRVMIFKTGQGDAGLSAVFKDITSGFDFNESLQIFNGKKQFNG
jgi:hypothetical protein